MQITAVEKINNKMAHKIIYYTLFFGISLLMSCKTSEVSSVEEYNKWMNDPENGLVKTKKIKGLTVSVKYLPAAYLIYKELGEKGYSEKGSDSLKKAYENALTFLMTIAPDQEKGNKNDIMMEGIVNYKEYSERLLMLNFQLDKNVTLKSGEVELKPVLSALENTYGLSKSRSITFVFVPDIKEMERIESAKMIDFVYIDDLFQLGIMHFNFNNEKLKELPVVVEYNEVSKEKL